MEFKVMSWNVGGAKYFALNKDCRQKFRCDLNQDLQKLVAYHQPHVIALQEVVEYSDDPAGMKESIIDGIDGYELWRKTVINSKDQSHVSKWTKLRTDENEWNPDAYLGQGLAMMWRKKLRLFPFPQLPNFGATPLENDRISCEVVDLTTGIYFGDRDTEPRKALIAHFMLTRPSEVKSSAIDPLEFLEKPIDIFVVNTHLTTLKGEREGIPLIDERASGRRLTQLAALFNEVISPYNDWRLHDYRDRHHPDVDSDLICRATPIWILAGDFNFTPDSPEALRVSGSNFLDMNPNKGSGTKASGIGNPPIFTVDYIFAGPRYEAFDPAALSRAVDESLPPSKEAKVSDHFPLVARIPIKKPELSKKEKTKCGSIIEKGKVTEMKRIKGDEESPVIQANPS